MVAVGFALQPDAEFLGRLDALIHDEPDYYEVAPETLWAPQADGGVAPNGYFRRFARLRRETGRPFVAHGVGLSLGSQSPRDAARQRRHLARVAEDHHTFRFLWYSDHLGVSAPAGAAATLPLPLPLTLELAATVRRRLRAMRRVVPAVAFENAVGYFVLGDPMDEPAFIREALREPGSHLVLDLHNVHTLALNLGFDARDWIARLPLERVIELHVSGGSESDPRWLPGGRRVRLDSHDGPVPEPVWRLLAETLPRCPHLRGVTLERMEGTLADGDEALLREELRRLRRLVGRDGTSVAVRRPRRQARRAERREAVARRRTPAWETVLLGIVRAADPAAALRRAARDARLSARLRRAFGQADADGVRIAALLVAKLRFERLLRGSAEVDFAFEHDPRGFTEIFRRYHAQAPLSAFDPLSEVETFRAWRARRKRRAPVRPR